MKKIILLLFILIVAQIRAQETVTLTTPITHTTSSSCTLIQFTVIPRIDNPPQGSISVVLSGSNPQDGFSKTYDSTTVPTGQTLISQLNKANFTVNSLLKNIYQRLSTDGVCTGTVTGTPQ